MAIFDCQMCGAELDISSGSTIVTCEYCKRQQTVPSVDDEKDDEKKVNLFNRANRLRLKCDFDAAANVYTSYVVDFPNDAEGYWGLCLCKFGIEYVDDPATRKRIPTCHRTSYESIFDDPDFAKACENADALSKELYQAEAKEIDRLQKEILEIAKNEKPFDVFICYKETDDDKQRTFDSELANDIYNVLTEKGYKVFYSRTTLKSHAGVDYEPYIFSALNSAKVLLAVGTKYEYFTSTWVKNEWSRFLALMKNDKSKKLIPCYRDIDPAADMPSEFRALQGVDMSGQRAFIDLVSNIEKIIPLNSSTSQGSAGVSQSAEATVDSLLDRVFEDHLVYGHWDEAIDTCNQILNANPKNARACIGILMANFRVSEESKLGKCTQDYGSNEYYDKALRYSDAAGKAKLKNYLENTRANITEINNNNTYNKAITAFEQENYADAKTLFAKIGGYRDADEWLKKSTEAYKAQSIENRYLGAMSSLKNGEYDTAKADFDELGDYKNSKSLSAESVKRISRANDFSDRCRETFRSYDETTLGPYAPVMQEYINLRSRMMSAYSWFDGETQDPEIPEPKSPAKKNAILLPLGISMIISAFSQSGSVYLVLGILIAAIANYNVRKYTMNISGKLYAFLSVLVMVFGGGVLGGIHVGFWDSNFYFGLVLFGLAGALLLFIAGTASIKYIKKTSQIKNYHKNLETLNELNGQRTSALNANIQSLASDYVDISPRLNDLLDKAQKNYRNADPSAVRMFAPVEITNAPSAPAAPQQDAAAPQQDIAQKTLKCAMCGAVTMFPADIESGEFHCSSCGAKISYTKV